MSELPGVRTTKEATARRILASVDGYQSLPGGGVIAGSKSRDPLNTGDTDVLRAGLMMGKITATGKWAPAVIGAVSAAYDGGTTVKVSAATAAEIVRRIGATGTFKLTGPATAGGTVRTLTATYSAVDTTKGEITIAALAVNEVQTVAIAGTLSAGAFCLVFDVAGVKKRTAAIAYNAAIADIQTAVDGALGSEKVVVGGSTIAEFTITFSGTGFAATAQPTVEVDIHTAITGLTAITVTRTTPGVPGAFIKGALVQPTDGSEVIRTLLTEQYGVSVTDEDNDDVDVFYPSIMIAGQIDASQIINYSADVSVQAYIKSSLNAYGNYVFDDDFVS